MNDLTRSDTDKILAGIVIPPRPQVLGQVLAEHARPEPDLKRITKLVSEDVGMAAAVLKTVNSPLYGLRRQISSLDQAVGYLGLRNLTTLLTGLALRQSVGGRGLERFWDSAARQALILMHLARALECVPKEDAHLYGLFHDAGMPLLMQRFPDYKETLRQANQSADRAFTEVEDARHQTNHAVVGNLLAANWGQPQTLRDAIRMHHELDVFASALPPAVLNLIALGILAEHIENGYARLGGDAEWVKLGQAAIAHLMLDEAQVNELSRESFELLEESGH